MRQISNIIDIEGKKRSLLDIRDNLYKAIIKNDKVRFSPLIKLERLKNKYRKNPSRIEVIDYCIDNFKSLIISTPLEQEQIIEAFDSRGFTNLIYNRNNARAKKFSKNLLIAFCYKEFRQTLLLDLAKQLNIKVCPYCNSQYTLFFENSDRNIKLADFQFDHFFPKTKYPYLSISFYNLIPSCSICNLRKSHKEFDLQSYIHPYLESSSDYFKFQINDTQAINLLMAIKILRDKIDIVLTNKDNIKVNNHNEVFNLEEIYGRHKDIVREIYIKSYAYNKCNKEQMLKWKKNDGTPIFRNMAELELIILSNYSLKEDINKRPLSKFTQDIARSSGLID
ncbi:hypothetical protein ES708_29140 [subsurface metagenome]